MPTFVFRVNSIHIGVLRRHRLHANLLLHGRSVQLYTYLGEPRVKFMAARRARGRGLGGRARVARTGCHPFRGDEELVFSTYAGLTLSADLKRMC
ncbi:hypothetical protein EVAR_103244_1 [Eumeta japonica]|uniref:Uncharacterized protein n=1 Tax=Eumeta variegata TaxID=151549 RepID=A0A4C1X678_EUMVA|nr:hypothetical protein EVAR_103244_1 [Eumeta japonica]